jgi:hypothetical protein
MGVAVRTGVEVLALRRRGRRIASLSTTAGEFRAGGRLTADPGANADSRRVLVGVDRSL